MKKMLSEEIRRVNWDIRGDGKVKVKLLGRVRLFVTPWTVAYQAPLSVGFSGKSTGVGSHFLLQEIFPTQGDKRSLIIY